ncbi:MAG: hypothetical protein U0Q16_20130 [Bryobacteraceae bacterium]
MRLLLAVAASSALFAADFTYTQKTDITGGSLKKMMDFARKFSRQPAGPTTTTHRIHGNKMTTETQRSVHVIDLDAETITEINNEKKEYSVITFAEMAAAMKQAAARMSQARKDAPDTEMKWKVSVDTPGDTRDVAGLKAKHAIMKLEMEATDKKTGASGVTDMNIDQWMAKVPGSEVQREFYKRYGEKMGMANGVDMSVMMQAGPGAMAGLREAGKKLSEMDGISVASVTRMMGMTANAPEGSAAPAADPKESARDAAVGAALGRLGGLGGLGRRKSKKDEPAAQPEQQPAQQQAAAQPGVMLEFTTEMTSFSSEAVDPSVFQVPAGYKQVDHPMKRMAK